MLLGYGAILLVGGFVQSNTGPQQHTLVGLQPASVHVSSTGPLRYQAPGNAAFAPAGAPISDSSGTTVDLPLLGTGYYYVSTRAGLLDTRIEKTQFPGAENFIGESRPLEVVTGQQWEAPWAGLSLLLLAVLGLTIRKRIGYVVALAATIPSLSLLTGELWLAGVASTSAMFGLAAAVFSGRAARVVSDDRIKAAGIAVLVLASVRPLHVGLMLGGLVIVGACLVARRLTGAALAVTGALLVAAVLSQGSGEITSITDVTCRMDGTFQQQEACVVQRYIADVSSPARVQAALAELEATPQEGVAGCHTVAHAIGRRLGADAQASEIAVAGGDRCLWGLLHGIVEGAAMRTDDLTFKTLMSSVCNPGALESTRRTNYVSQCWHGSGHAVYMRTGGRINPAAQMCRAADTGTDCLTGVMMSHADAHERVLRLASNTPAKVAADLANPPYHACLELVDDASREVCVRQTIRYWPAGTDGYQQSVQDGFTWCTTQQNIKADWCAQGVGTALAPVDGSVDPGWVSRTCGAFAEHKNTCIEWYAFAAGSTPQTINGPDPLARVCAGLDEVCATTLRKLL
jgi:hypothetical protein